MTVFLMMSDTYLVTLDCWTARLHCKLCIVDESRGFQKNPLLGNKMVKMHIHKKLTNKKIQKHTLQLHLIFSHNNITDTSVPWMSAQLLQSPFRWVNCLIACSVLCVSLDFFVLLVGSHTLLQTLSHCPLPAGCSEKHGRVRGYHRAMLQAHRFLSFMAL